MKNEQHSTSEREKEYSQPKGMHDVLPPRIFVPGSSLWGKARQRTYRCSPTSPSAFYPRRCSVPVLEPSLLPQFSDMSYFRAQSIAADADTEQSTSWSRLCRTCRDLLCSSQECGHTNERSRPSLRSWSSEALPEIRSGAPAGRHRRVFCRYRIRLPREP